MAMALLQTIAVRREMPILAATFQILAIRIFVHGHRIGTEIWHEKDPERAEVIQHILYARQTAQPRWHFPLSVLVLAGCYVSRHAATLRFCTSRRTRRRATGRKEMQALGEVIDFTLLRRRSPMSAGDVHVVNTATSSSYTLQIDERTLLYAGPLGDNNGGGWHFVLRSANQVFVIGKCTDENAVTKLVMSLAEAIRR
jgi:hypothetical protein